MKVLGLSVTVLALMLVFEAHLAASVVKGWWSMSYSLTNELRSEARTSLDAASQRCAHPDAS